MTLNSNSDDNYEDDGVGDNDEDDGVGDNDDNDNDDDTFSFI